MLLLHSSDISFLYESASQAISPSSLEAIDKQSIDTGGRFNAKINAPDSQGIVSVTAVYNGAVSGLQTCQLLNTVILADRSRDRLVMSFNK
jgi:hypothetical protein